MGALLTIEVFFAADEFHAKHFLATVPHFILDWLNSEIITFDWNAQDNEDKKCDFFSLDKQL